MLSQARQELLCRDIQRSSEAVFPETLRSSGKWATDTDNEATVAKYNYSSMGLHECVGKAWVGALSSSHTSKDGGERNDFSTVLLQGVEVSTKFFWPIFHHKPWQTCFTAKIMNIILGII